MPGLSGLEVKERLGKSDPDLPVILITGNADITLDLTSNPYGFAACLSKPFDPPELLSAITRACIASKAIPPSKPAYQASASKSQRSDVQMR